MLFSSLILAFHLSHSCNGAAADVLIVFASTATSSTSTNFILAFSKLCFFQQASDGEPQSLNIRCNCSTCKKRLNISTLRTSATKNELVQIKCIFSIRVRCIKKAITNICSSGQYWRLSQQLCQNAFCTPQIDTDTIDSFP